MTMGVVGFSRGGESDEAPSQNRGSDMTTEDLQSQFKDTLSRLNKKMTPQKESHS